MYRFVKIKKIRVKVSTINKLYFNFFLIFSFFSAFSYFFNRIQLKRIEEDNIVVRTLFFLIFICIFMLYLGMRVQFENTEIFVDLKYLSYIVYSALIAYPLTRNMITTSDTLSILNYTLSDKSISSIGFYPLNFIYFSKLLNKLTLESYFWTIYVLLVFVLFLYFFIFNINIMARYKYSLFQTFIISSHILLFLNFYYFFARKGSFIVIASYLVLSTLVIMQINIKKKFIFNIGSLFILFWSYPTLAFVFMLLHFVLLPYSIVTSLYVLIFLIVAAFLFNYIDSSTLQIHLITYTPASIQPIDFTNFIGKAYVVISQYSNIQFFSSILSTILIVIIGGILIHNKLVLFKYLIVSFYFFTSLLDGYSNLFSRLAFFMSIPIMSNFNFSSTFYSNLLALNHERLAIMRKTLIFLLLLIFFNIVSMYFLYT